MAAKTTEIIRFWASSDKNTIFVEVNGWLKKSGMIDAVLYNGECRKIEYKVFFEKSGCRELIIVPLFFELLI